MSGLSVPMRRLLWTIAQHKYGWAYCGPEVRRMQTAEALERRGLVAINRSRPYALTCSPTEMGRGAIALWFPVSPYILGTYDHQPGGWTPLAAAGADTEPAA
jgi:hypothetical protein